MSLDPTKVSTRIAALTDKWTMVDALYGGTSTMRQAVRYLPRNSKESEIDWRPRLNRTSLYNVYKRSIQQAAARIFAEDIVLEGFPPEMNVFIQDVDAQGRDITQFIKADFIDALNRGVSYILVEYPKREEQPLTLADALVTGERPYWVQIEATQVLAAHSALSGGIERLTHFRFKETVMEVSDDGLEETLHEQVKAFYQTAVGEPVTFRVWRNHKTKGWMVVDQGTLLGQPAIPVVPIYTNRTGFYLGAPPLLDLAETNIAHWQSSSEQRNILHVARVPFLHINGLPQEFDDKGKLVAVEVNIHSALVTSDPAAKAQWIETNGNALAAGAADLADLEAKMDALGLSLSTPRSGTSTATENSINAAEANSLLKDMARSLSDSIELALYYTAFYLDVDPNTNGKVTVSTKFAVDLQETSTTPETDQA